MTRRFVRGSGPVVVVQVAVVVEALVVVATVVPEEVVPSAELFDALNVPEVIDVVPV